MAVKMLMARWPMIADVFHPKRGSELDLIRIDLALFLRNGLFFPIQIKTHPNALPTHFRKCPYIYATAVTGRTNVEMLANEFEEVVRKHAEKFHELKSCAPNWGIDRPRSARKRPGPLLKELSRNSRLISSYHQADRNGQLFSCGATGIVFLRNGFAALIRRDWPGIPPLRFPGIVVPPRLTPRDEALRIIEEIKRRAKELRDC